MTCRIEVAGSQSNDWVSVGLVEQSDDEVRQYVCVVKRLYPGCRVRALNSVTQALIAIV